jgi:hypothetical protein
VRWCRLVWVAGVRRYPTLHAQGQGLVLVYQLLFLFGHTKFWSPLLRIGGLTVERVPPDPFAGAGGGVGMPEMPGLSSGSEGGGLAGLAELVGGGSASAERAGVPSTSSTSWSVLGAAGNGLATAAKWGAIGGLVGFKLMEWYFAADTQERLAPRRREGNECLPPPTPISSVVGTSGAWDGGGVGGGGGSGGGEEKMDVVSEEDGGESGEDGGASARKGRCALPENKRLCPLCVKDRVNAAASTGGFVFCYPCLYAHVDETSKTCPVTGLPCTLEQIRRVFEPSS